MNHLRLLPDLFSVCRLDPAADLPAWAGTGGLASVTRTPDELSVVCVSDRVPSEVQSEPGWRVLQVEGPLDFSLVGILSSLLRPLAEARIPVFVLSTYDTDYLFVKATFLEAACRAFTDSGHLVAR